MFRFIPQKKRSKLRVLAGTAVYCCLRYCLWLRYGKRFAAACALTEEQCAERFPYAVFMHSTPLFRNLSKEDSELQQGKAHNLRIAVKALDKTVLEPGQVFSFWRLIGNPTRLKGYTKGMMLVNGRSAAKTGGGLCALSNLVYWMTLHTPLSVAERFRHSYDVFPDSNRTQPFGSGATCVYNYRDLMIRNETAARFLLRVWIADGRLCGQWRSSTPCAERYEVYQKDHWITAETGGAYVRHNTLYRRVFIRQDGGETLLCDEKITENHALMMYAPFLEKP